MGENMKIFLGYILTYGWVFLVLGATALLKRKAGLTDEGSRKIVHVTVGFAWIAMYFCFGASWHLLIPPLTFVALNYISYKKDLFTAMERSDKDAASLGTVYYPISMTALALLTLADGRFLVPYGIGLMCMALGDGLAPYFGAIKRGNRPLLGGKRTIWGTLSVFAVCWLVAGIMTLCFSLPLTWYETALLGLAGAILELIGLRGFDNLTLPIGVGLLSWLLIVF